MTNHYKVFNQYRCHIIVRQTYTASVYSDICPTRCNVTQFIYLWKTSVLVSGGISTHHQEHTQLYLQHLALVSPLLLPAAIVEKMELKFQLFHDSNCADCACVLVSYFLLLCKYFVPDVLTQIENS